MPSAIEPVTHIFDRSNIAITTGPYGAGVGRVMITRVGKMGARLAIYFQISSLTVSASVPILVTINVPAGFQCESTGFVIFGHTSFFNSSNVSVPIIGSVQAASSTAIAVAVDVIRSTGTGFAVGGGKLIVICTELLSHIIVLVLLEK